MHRSCPPAGPDIDPDPNRQLEVAVIAWLTLLTEKWAQCQGVCGEMSNWALSRRAKSLLNACSGHAMKYPETVLDELAAAATPAGQIKSSNIVSWPALHWHGRDDPREMMPPGIPHR